MGQRDESDWRYYGWLVVLTCFVVIAIGSGARFAFGVILDPLVVTFDASRTAISITQSVQLVAYAVSQPVMGRLIDRYGPAPIFAGSILAVAGGLAGAAFVGSVLGLYLTLGALVGFGYGGIGALAIVTILARWFRDRRESAVSLANSGFNVGQLAIAPLLGFALTVIDWQTALVALGVLMLLTLLPAVAVLRRRRRADADVDGDGSEFAGTLDVSSVREAVRGRSYAGLLSSYFICGFTDFVVIVHLVSYLVGVGFSRPIASTALGLVGGASFVGVVVCGWIADRTRTKDVIAGLYAMRIGGYLLLILVGSVASLETVLLYVFVVVFGFSLYATAPLTSTLTATLYGDSLTGTLYGWASATHHVGAAIGAAAAAWVFDTTGTYEPAFYLCAGLLVVGTVAAYAIVEPRSTAAGSA